MISFPNCTKCKGRGLVSVGLHSRRLKQCPTCYKEQVRLDQLKREQEAKKMIQQYEEHYPEAKNWRLKMALAMATIINR